MLLQHHYALKANNSSQILSILKDRGFGIDAVSGNEVRWALDHGFKPSEIVFSGVGKTDAELKLAIDKKIAFLNIESEFEYENALALAQKQNSKLRVALRINPNVNAKSHPYISTGLKSHKFGLDLSIAKRLIAKIATQDFIALEGLSIHIGSQMLDLAPLEEALRKSLDFYESLPAKHKKHIHNFDVGGGLGIHYSKPALLPDFPSYAKLLRKFAQSWRQSCINKNPSLACENGRSIVAQSGLLVSQVIGIKKTPHKIFAVVDASMSELMRPSLYQARHEIMCFKKSTQIAPYSVVGPVCESSDSFGDAFYLPKVLKKGDYLGIDSSGAYGSAMSHFYNLRELPAEFWIFKNSKVAQKRSRVSFAQLYQI